MLLPEMIGCIALVVDFVGLLCLKKARPLKLSMATGSCFWALQSALLGAAGGALVLLVTAMRQCFGAFSEQISQKQRFGAAIIFSGVTITFFVINFSRNAELLILSASLIATWGFIYLGSIGLRKMLTITIALYFFYGLAIGSTTLMISSALDFAINAYVLSNLLYYKPFVESSKG